MRVDKKRSRLGSFYLLFCIVCFFSSYSFAQDRTFEESVFHIPLAGTCEKLAPDPAYVEEMLIDVESIGSQVGEMYERRVALVVGNSNYRSIDPLKNPGNDATAMTRVLRAIGFTVFRGIDLDAVGLEACIDDYAIELERQPADLSLFFYAGHGVQLISEADTEKRNYMLATDARIDSQGKGVGFKQVDTVLAEMRSRSGQAVFFYDACRNDPLGEDAPETIDGVAISRQVALSLEGAAVIEVDEGATSDQAGLYIAYATAPNRVADDAYEADANHSPFTQSLLNHIASPGYSLERVMSYVSNDVGELTGWNQTPWTSSSLVDEVKLNGTLTEAEAINFVKSELQEVSNLIERFQLSLATDRLNLLESLVSRLKNKGSGLRTDIERKKLSLKKIDLISILEYSPVAIFYSENGAYIYTLGEAGQVSVFERRTGRVLKEVLHTHPIASADFDRFNQRLLFIDHREMVYSISTDSLELKIESEFDARGAVSDWEPVRVIVAQPKGAGFVLAPSFGTAVLFYSSQKERLYRTTLSKNLKHRSFAFSGDGMRLVVSENHSAEGLIIDSSSLVSWSLQDVPEVVSSVDLPFKIQDLWWEKQSRLIAHDDTNRRFVGLDAFTGEVHQVREFDGYSTKPNLISPSANVFMSSMGNQLRVFEASSLQKIASYKFEDREISKIAIHGRDKLLVAYKSGHLVERDLRYILPLPIRLKKEVGAIACSPDGSHIAIGAEDASELQVWDLNDHELIARLTFEDEPRNETYQTLADVKFAHGGGSLVFVPRLGNITIVDTEEWIITSKFELYPSNFDDEVDLLRFADTISISSDGKLIVSNSGPFQGVDLWSVDSIETPAVYQAPGWVEAVAFTNENEILLAGENAADLSVIMSVSGSADDVELPDADVSNVLDNHFEFDDLVHFGINVRRDFVDLISIKNGETSRITSPILQNMEEVELAYGANVLMVSHGYPTMLSFFDVESGQLLHQDEFQHPFWSYGLSENFIACGELGFAAPGFEEDEVLVFSKRFLGLKKERASETRVSGDASALFWGDVGMQ
ncbi:MAG: caspase family protein [Henriciella sp.]